MVAAVPPMVTAVALVKLVPVIVTTAPAPPLLGVNEVMVGAGMKVKFVALVAVPPGVVTVIGPVAPLPTVTVMLVALLTVNGGRHAAEGDRRGAGEVRPGNGHSCARPTTAR